MITLRQVQSKFPEAKQVDGRNGTEYVVNCRRPHKKGGVSKVHINAKEGVYYCHDCNDKGNANTEWFDEVGLMISSLEVHRESPINSKEQNIKTRSYRKSQLWEDNVPSPGSVIPLNDLDEDHPAISYLKNRGFDTNEICNFKDNQRVYYCSRGNTYSCGTTTGRIIFPVYMNGVMGGWQARRIEKETVSGKETTRETWNNFFWTKVERTPNGKWEDNKTAKCITCPGTQKGAMLFGYDEAKLNQDPDNKMIVIVEGPLDQIKVGYPAVATFGMISNHQIRLILSHWDTAIIIRDPEIKEDSDKFQKILNDLSPITVINLSLPDNKDPGATSREVIWEQINKKLDNAKQWTRKSTN